MYVSPLDLGRSKSLSFRDLGGLAPYVEPSLNMHLNKFNHYYIIYVTLYVTFHFGLIYQAITFPNSGVLTPYESSYTGIVIRLKQPISQIMSMQLLFIFTTMIY